MTERGGIRPTRLIPQRRKEARNRRDGGTPRPRPACGSLLSAASGDSCVALLHLAPCPETAVAINKQR